MTLQETLAARLRLPVIVAPMFLSSGPELVVACSKSGVIGSFPALNQRSSAGLDEWLDQIRGELEADTTAAPFAVNLIVHQTNPRVQADLALIVKHRVPLVITSLGAAREVVDAVHGYGGLVFHDVTTTRHARKAAEAGVDGLILVAAGAGGHAGTWSPFALLGEVRREFDGTVVLAGSLSTGTDIAAAQMMGADLVYMGTRFNASAESLASTEYKQMLVAATASDIVYTPAICTVPANFMRQSIAAAGLDPDRLAAAQGIDMRHVTQPYRKELESAHAKPWRDIWSAGQGVGAVVDLPPVHKLVDRLCTEYRAALRDFTAAAERFALI
jgi:nitronate monooxygenase